MNTAKYEQELAERLEQLYPKGESRERSKALVFNAFAVLLMRKMAAELDKKQS